MNQGKQLQFWLRKLPLASTSDITTDSLRCLPRTADISDLLWCPMDSLQLRHCTPMRQWLSQEHISSKVPDVKYTWHAQQQEHYPYPFPSPSILFNGCLQAILNGRHCVLKTHVCSYQCFTMFQWMRESLFNNTVSVTIINGTYEWHYTVNWEYVARKRHA